MLYVHVVCASVSFFCVCRKRSRNNALLCGYPLSLMKVELSWQELEVGSCSRARSGALSLDDAAVHVVGQPLVDLARVRVHGAVERVRHVLEPLLEQQPRQVVVERALGQPRFCTGYIPSFNEVNISIVFWKKRGPPIKT